MLRSLVLRALVLLLLAFSNAPRGAHTPRSEIKALHDIFTSIRPRDDQGNYANISNTWNFSINARTGKYLDDPCAYGMGHESHWMHIVCNNYNNTATNITTHITELRLVGIYPRLYGTIPDSIGDLSYMEILFLYENELRGSLPSGIGKMTRLMDLSINNNYFTSSLPSELGDCVALQHLNIFLNGFTGSIPNLIKLAPSLQSFVADKNSLEGTIPSSFESLTGLTKLSLIANAMTGSLPDGLSALSRLEYLSFWLNFLSSSIPPSFGQLSGLTMLDLRTNSLTGSIPDALVKLTALKSLMLRTNSLTSSIPTNVGNLASLTYLDLNTNSLSGALPTSICLLTKLQYLIVHQNELSQKIPSQIGFLTALRTLSTYQNEFTGPLPPSLGLLSNLQNLLLYSNSFSKMPDEIGRLSNLQTFSIESNSITGTIPSALASLVSIQILSLAYNSFAGTVPLALATSLTALTNLDMSDNFLDGFWPEFNKSRSLEKLSIGGNLFKGPLPRLRYNKAMKILNASSNFFTGPLDPWYGSLFSMNVLNVSFNRLSGNFSEAICRLSSLNVLDLDYAFAMGSEQNQTLSAGLSCLGAIRSLQVLKLQGNRIKGSIPLSFKNFPAMRMLSLRHNEIHGSIEEDFFANMSLSLNHLSLANNNISGHVPSSLCSMGGLTHLNLSTNRFQFSCDPNWPSIQYLDLSNNPQDHGANITQLPAAFPVLVVLILSGVRIDSVLPDFSSLSSLTSLQLSNCGIRGQLPAIPSSLGDLRLDNNQLTGILPFHDFQFFPFETVDLSFNRLQGKLPSINISNIITCLLCNKLRTLRLSNNLFSGSLSDQFTYLNQLETIDMSNNRITGDVPLSLALNYGLKRALVSIDLSHNAFSSSVPSNLALLSSLNVLDLSFNRLTGPLPLEFSSTSVNVASNLFVGSLPSSMCPRNEGGSGLNPGFYLNITGNKITCYPTCTSSAGGKTEPLPSIGKQIFVDPSVKVCPAPPVFSNSFYVQQLVIGCSGDEFQNSCLPAFRDTIAAVYAQNAPPITASSTFSGFEVTDQNGIAVIQLSYAVNFAAPPTYDYSTFSNILIQSISNGVFLKLLVSFAVAGSCLTKGVTLKSITTIEKQLPSVDTVVSYQQSLQTMLFLVFLASIPFIMVAAYIKRKRDKDRTWNAIDKPKDYKPTHCYITHLADRHLVDGVDVVHNKVQKIKEALEKRTIKVNEGKKPPPEAPDCALPACRNTSNPEIFCFECQQVYYCSPACQNLHWAAHRENNVHVADKVPKKHQCEILAEKKSSSSSAPSSTNSNQEKHLSKSEEKMLAAENRKQTTKMQIKVWFDQRRAEPSDKHKRLSKFKAGIKSTSVVLPIITKDYARRLEGLDREAWTMEFSQFLLQFCCGAHREIKRNVVQHEFFYANDAKLSKQFVPIVLEEGMSNQKEWNGWLARGLKDLLFIHLYDENIWVEVETPTQGRGMLILNQGESKEYKGKWGEDSSFHVFENGQIITKQDLQKEGTVFARDDEDTVSETSRVSNHQSARPTTTKLQLQKKTYPKLIYKDGTWLNKDFEDQIDKLQHQIQLAFYSEQRTDVFLAHTWGKGEKSHGWAKKVNMFLQSQQRSDREPWPLETWFDEDRMTEEVKKSMRNGLDNTEVALVFVTEEYQGKVNGAEDSNAQFEFYHIAADFIVAGAVIPIICEKSMKNRQNWNGYMAKISSSNGVDFSDAWGDDEASRLTFDAKCQELLLEIRKTLDKLEGPARDGCRKQFTKDLIDKEKEGERIKKENEQRLKDEEAAVTAAKRNSLFFRPPALKVEQVDENDTSSVDIEAQKTRAPATGMSIELNPMHSLGFAAAMGGGGGGGGGSSIARDEIPKSEK